jgi:protein PhnA
MAKGRQKHDEKQQALSRLGGPLNRRAKSKCELCGASGVPLRVTEVAPAPADPDPERCLMLCEPCRDGIERGPEGERWRFLEETVWSELAPAQVASVRLVRRIDAAWARALLDGLWLDEEIRTWIDAG